MPDHAIRVFLSYRREDTPHLAGRLADRLTDRFGSAQVFMDVDTIAPGADFAAAITDAVAICDLLIAMIGRNWLTIVDNDGRRRLDDPDDFVVLEIKTALERDIRVIPVLVDGADMPGRNDLPEVLRGLARRNAIRLDHETFRSDLSQLVSVIERTLGTDPDVSTGEAGDVEGGSLRQSSIDASAPDSSLRNRGPSNWRATLIEYDSKKGFFASTKFSILLELDDEQHTLTYTTKWKFHLYLDGQQIWTGGNLKNLGKTAFPIRDGNAVRILAIKGNFLSILEHLKANEVPPLFIEIHVDGHELIRFQAV